MKIILFAPVYYPWMQTFTEAFSTNFNFKSYMITFGSTGNYPGWDSLYKNFDNLFLLKPRKMFSENIANPYTLLEIIGKTKPNIVILLYSEGLSALLLYFISRLFGCKVIIIAEENQPRKTFGLKKLLYYGKIALIKYSHKRSDYILSESISTYYYLINYLNMHKNKILIWPHSVDYKEFGASNPNANPSDEILNKINSAEGKLKILYLGGYYKHKGIDFIFKAINECKDNNKFLWVIPEIGKDDKISNSLKTIKNVLLIHPIPYTDLKFLYRTIDVVVVPSYITEFNSERSANVILEAMASKKLVIASHIGGNPSLLGDSGIILNYDQLNNLSYYLTYIEKNRDIIKMFTEKGTARIQEIFTPKMYAQMFLLNSSEGFDQRNKNFIRNINKILEEPSFKIKE